MDATRIQIKLIIVTVLMLGVALACPLFPEKETTISSDIGDYSFNSETIIDALAQGEQGVFSPLSETPTPAPVHHPKTTAWNSLDFLLVARAFHQFYWQETLDEWQFCVVWYDYHCADVTRGPYSAKFWLYKVNNRPEGKTSVLHTTSIYRDGEIIWLEEEKTPVGGQWYYMHTEPEQVRISAEDAVQIADENGWLALRSRIENNCEISVSANGPQENEWLVSYIAFSLSPLDHVWDRLFKIKINMDTGNITAVYPPGSKK